jgi:hypothetical protein
LVRTTISEYTGRFSPANTTSGLTNTTKKKIDEKTGENRKEAGGSTLWGIKNINKERGNMGLRPKYHPLGIVANRIIAGKVSRKRGKRRAERKNCGKNHEMSDWRKNSQTLLTTENLN